MRPVVGVTCCYHDSGEVTYDCVQRKYIDAVAQVAGCQPLLMPTLGADSDVEALLGAVDGVLITGSPSNVAPEHYGGPPSRPEVLLDRRRDETVLPLIRPAIDAGVPLFALCRGLQELNVAYGGTLHQHVEELADTLDHREDTSVPEAERYGPAHEVEVRSNGVLWDLIVADVVEVSSLHGQAIDRVAPGLTVEATAPDGIVEALSVDGARRFALGVQWHAEWRAQESLVSRLLFKAFGRSCQERMEERLRL